MLLSLPTTPSLWPVECAVGCVDSVSPKPAALGVWVVGDRSAALRAALAVLIVCVFAAPPHRRLR